GPYDVAVIESTDPQALIDWLRANDFRITDAMKPYIRVYTEEGLKFLALKLQPGKGVSEIQPFKFTLPGDIASIPLRMTAVAAEPDMGILVFFLGDRRFGPANWADVKVDDNDLVQDPTTGKTNWEVLVSRGVDEAGGRGFVTELAESTDR